MTNARRSVILALLLALPLSLGSCRELAAAIEAANGGGRGGNADAPGGGSDGGSDNGDNFNVNDSAELPFVRLTASNVSPQAGEEVVLSCELVSGSSQDLVFSFQPQSSRLIVDAQQGTASFVVDQTDVGIEQTFTCSASNVNGRGDASNSLDVVATAPPGVP